MVDIAQRLEEWAASPITKAEIRSVKAVMRIAAEHLRELEQDAARYQHVRAHGMPKLCPAGFYYHDGVFYPTADAAIDAYMAASKGEKG